jgi:hypothetical protein
MKATGNCYQEAAEWVLAHEGWVLVHGYPTLSIDPFKPYGHAWAEYDGHVMAPGAIGEPLTPYPREWFYRAGNIDPDQCRYYTKPETRMMLVKQKDWGPWHEGPEGTIVPKSLAST